MDERRATTESNRETEFNNDQDIGAGKKTGLYGCGFLLLAVVIVFAALVLTGTYNPFQRTEGVGP